MAFLKWSLLLLILSWQLTSATQYLNINKGHLRVKRESFINLGEVPNIMYGFTSSMRRGLNNIMHQGKSFGQRMYGLGSSLMKTAHRNGARPWKPISSSQSLYQGADALQSSYGVPYAPVYTTPSSSGGSYDQFSSYEEPSHSSYGGSYELSSYQSQGEYGSQEPLPTYGGGGSQPTYGSAEVLGYGSQDLPSYGSSSASSSSNLPSYGASSSSDLPSYSSNGGAAPVLQINYEDCNCHFGSENSFKPIISSNYDAAIDSYGKPLSGVVVTPKPVFTATGAPYVQPELKPQQSYAQTSPPQITYNQPPVSSQSSYAQPAISSNPSYNSKPAVSSTIINQANNQNSLYNKPILTTTFVSPLIHSKPVPAPKPVSSHSTSTFSQQNIGSNPSSTYSQPSQSFSNNGPPSIPSSSSYFPSVSTPSPVSTFISSPQNGYSSGISSSSHSNSALITTSEPVYQPSGFVDTSPAPQSVNEIHSNAVPFKEQFFNPDEAHVRNVLVNTLFYKDVASFIKYHKNRKIHHKPGNFKTI